MGSQEAQHSAPGWEEVMERAARAGEWLASHSEPVLTPIAQCLGEVPAADLLVSAPVPHYDSSAMDGYAVVGPPPWRIVDRAEFEDAALSAASLEPPAASLPPESPADPSTSVASAQSGSTDAAPGMQRQADSANPATTSAATTPGTSLATPVVTGSQIPAGTVSVVRQEFTRRDSGILELSETAGQVTGGRKQSIGRDLEPGRNIRRAGREAKAGDLIAAAGAPMTPAHIAFAAVTGVDGIAIAPRVRVGVLLTGDEVITSGIPTPGTVRDAFSPQLPGYIEQLGGHVVGVVRARDEMNDTQGAVRELLVADAQLIVTTGGSGHSRVDFVRALAEDMRVDSEDPGLDFTFPEIHMRPGHPTFLYACDYRPTAVGVTNLPERITAGQPVLHLGLPGNPLAAMVAVRIALAALLRAGRGMPREAVGAETVGEAIAGGTSARVLPAVRDAQGRWVSTGAHGSNMLRGLAMAQALIVIPEAGCQAGDRVPVLGLG